jgi:SAM-dependent methyltransferase
MQMFISCFLSLMVERALRGDSGSGSSRVVHPAAAVRAEVHGTALDAERLAVDQCVGDLSVRRFDDAAESRARDPHASGGLLVVQALEISQAQRLELVEGHDDLLETAQGNPGGLEHRRARAAADVALAEWPWHGLIMSICSFSSSGDPSPGELDRSGETNVDHDHHFQGDPDRLRSPERVARLQLDRVVALALEGIEARSVLDVGTGTGLFAEAFAARGLVPTGVDDSDAMLELARAHVPRGTFQQAIAEALPFPDRSFDLVLLGFLLHESADPLQALREARRVARERVAILEWPYREEEHGPPLAHRIEPEGIARLVAQAGFAASDWVALGSSVLYRLAP